MKSQPAVTQVGLHTREGTSIVTNPITNLNTELLRTAERLATEYTGLPTGSVLRCYARSVRRLRVSGTVGNQLPAKAEALTRHLLDLRQSAPLTV